MGLNSPAAVLSADIDIHWTLDDWFLACTIRTLSTAQVRIRLLNFYSLMLMPSLLFQQLFCHYFSSCFVTALFVSVVVSVTTICAVVVVFAIAAVFVVIAVVITAVVFVTAVVVLAVALSLLLLLLFQLFVFIIVAVIVAVVLVTAAVVVVSC